MGDVRAARSIFVVVALLLALPVLLAARPTTSVVEVSRDVAVAPNHTSPQLVVSPVDPDHLVGIGIERDGPEIHDGTCVLYTSRDGGNQWTATPLPQGEGTDCPFITPSVAFHDDGTLYAAYFTPVPGSQGRIIVAISTDGGHSFPTTTVVPGSPREMAAAATGAGVTAPIGIDIAVVGDAIAVGWNGESTSAQSGGAMLVATSNDGGATFTSPTRILGHTLDPEDGGLQAHQPSFAVTGDRLHIAYGAWYNTQRNVQGTLTGTSPSHLNYFWDFAVMYATSGDGGASWSTPRAVAHFLDYEGGGTSPSRLAFAAHEDNLYVAWDDTAQGTVNRRVYLLRSPDGGDTWSDESSLWDGPGLGIPHERAAIAIAPNGRVDVAFYDGRNDPHSMQAFCPEAPAVCHGRDVYIASSFDGGATFTANRRVSDVTFEAVNRSYQATKRNAERLGWLGLAATDEGSVLLWEQSDRTVGVGKDRSEDPLASWTLVTRRVPAAAVTDPVVADGPVPGAPTSSAPGTDTLPATGGGLATLMGALLLPLAARRRG